MPQGRKDITIKNIEVLPKSLPNDGNGKVKIRCTVFSPSDHAVITNVRLDLRHTFLFRRVDMELDTSNALSPSNEGDYVAQFDIPEWMDIERYRLPIIAIDDQDGKGEKEGYFHVTFHRHPSPPPIGTQEFRERLEALGKAPFTDGNKIQPLYDGKEALEKRLEMIYGAKKQINIQTYTLSHTGAGEKIVNALVKKADSGVEVNVLLNGDSQIPTSPIGTLRLRLNEYLAQATRSAAKAFEGELSVEKLLGALNIGPKEGGINLAMFSGRDQVKAGAVEKGDAQKIDHWLARMVNANLKKPIDETLPRDWLSALRGPGGLPALPLLDHAVHEKILVVDGQAAIVGGRNLENQYFSHWKDLDLYVEGPLVEQIQRGFIANFKEVSELEKEPADPIELFDTKPADPGLKCQFVQSKPWTREYHALFALLGAIESAKERFYASSQYLVLPDSLLRDAILDAADRGVDVRLLINSFRTCQEVNFSSGFFVSLNFLGPLLDKGVRIYQMLGKDNEYAPQPYLHQKDFYFDSKLAAVGSFNLSMRSSYIETENLVFVDDEQFTKKMEKQFIKTLDEKAQEITPEVFAELKTKYKNRMEISRLLELLY